VNNYRSVFFSISDYFTDFPKTYFEDYQKLGSSSFAFELIFEALIGQNSDIWYLIGQTRKRVLASQSFISLLSYKHGNRSYLIRLKTWKTRIFKMTSVSYGELTEKRRRLL
jgi:hypothetical protein